MASTLSLFAYGSFSKGMVHYNKISPYVKSVETAYIQACVYRLEVGYPVLLNSDPRSEEENKRQKIEGYLMELEGPDLVFKLLDEFHGFNPLVTEKSLYFRETVEASCESGGCRPVTVYTLNPKKLPKTATRIENGDWAADLKAKPLLTELLSDKQVSYVKKLGASTGREIIPIDLALYRELMKMDLIVDKGRRLALTKLGKEVFRYLE